jgi:hypothetical protein
MGQGDYRFTFSTLKKAPGWTGTSITPAKPTFDWSQTQTGVGYARGVVTPITGKVNPARGGGGWITSFKNDDEIYLRMANGGTAMGVPSDILKAYLRRFPNATLESIPKDILTGTTLRRASDLEDPNSTVNQLNREINALHKNHPDDVLSPLERAQLVRKYGQDALGEYDKVYPASATLADTAGSDPATVGHPKSYAGNLTGNANVVGATPPPSAPPPPGPDTGTGTGNPIIDDWLRRVMENGSGNNVTTVYNPADMIRAVNERVLGNARVLSERQKQGNDWMQNNASLELEHLENTTPSIWGGGLGGNHANAIQAARQRLQNLQTQNSTGAFAPVRGTPTGTAGGYPTNSFQPGYSSFWGGGGWS